MKFSFRCRKKCSRLFKIYWLFSFRSNRDPKYESRNANSISVTVIFSLLYLEASYVICYSLTTVSLKLLKCFNFRDEWLVSI